MITVLQEKENVFGNILVMDPPLSQNFGEYITRFLKSNWLFLQLTSKYRPNNE